MSRIRFLPNWNVFLGLFLCSAAACAAAQTIDSPKPMYGSFRYMVGGGIPGAGRFVNILDMSRDGTCRYKTLQADYSFSVDSAKAEGIFQMARTLIEKYAMQHYAFRPDTVIAKIGLRMDSGTAYKEIYFYADEFLEEKYSVYRRPPEFKSLEATLRSILRENAVKETDIFAD